jgi:RND family efflux transporter MFP subunit
VVTARKVSVGELVGGDHTSELASIVQMDPIWVWFNLSERDVQRVRAQMAKREVTISELINKVPVEVGLQTDTGYPHKGVLDYVSPDLNQSTGTLQVRGIFENAKGALLPGYFVRVRVPLRAEQALLVPEVAVGSDQAGRYVLVVNADGIVEQRRVQLGQTSGAMRVVESTQARRARRRIRHPRRGPGPEGRSAAADADIGGRRADRIEIAAQYDF